MWEDIFWHLQSLSQQTFHALTTSMANPHANRSIQLTKLDFFCNGPGSHVCLRLCGPNWCFPLSPEWAGLTKGRCKNEHMQKTCRRKKIKMPKSHQCKKSPCQTTRRCKKKSVMQSWTSSSNGWRECQIVKFIVVWVLFGTAKPSSCCLSSERMTLVFWFAQAVNSGWWPVFVANGRPPVIASVWHSGAMCIWQMTQVLSPCPMTGKWLVVAMTTQWLGRCHGGHNAQQIEAGAMFQSQKLTNCIPVASKGFMSSEKQEATIDVGMWNPWSWWLADADGIELELSSNTGDNQLKAQAGRHWGTVRDSCLGASVEFSLLGALQMSESKRTVRFECNSLHKRLTPKFWFSLNWTCIRDWCSLLDNNWDNHFRTTPIQTHLSHQSGTEKDWKHWSITELMFHLALDLKETPKSLMSLLDCRNLCSTGSLSRLSMSLPEWSSPRSNAS